MTKIVFHSYIKSFPLTKKYLDFVRRFTQMVVYEKPSESNKLYQEKLLSNAENVILLCRNGVLKKAVDTLYLLQQVDTNDIYLSLLQTCINMKSLKEGKRVHAHMIQTGFHPDVFLQTKIVTMYAKCGDLEFARNVFDKMPNRNTTVFNVLITVYGKEGRIEDAREVFHEMPKQNVARNVISWNAMVSGYVQNLRVEDAHKVFDEMPQRDVVSWNTLIAGYAKEGNIGLVFELFREMLTAGVEADGFTYSSMVVACCDTQGLQVHGRVIKAGLDFDVFVSNPLISMYVGVGNMEDACKVFEQILNKNVVSWNAILSGYVQNNKLDDAQKQFDRMPERDVVAWTALIAGYTQNGNIDRARDLFDKMPVRNVVSWTAMIVGYTQNGLGEEALELFFDMQRKGTRPNHATFSSVLTACASCAALKQGKLVHLGMVKLGMQPDVISWSSLVDMYAKCGNIYDALHVFRKIPVRNLVSWNAMITGYAHHGLGNEAVLFFEEMLQTGIKPNSITFLGVLSACRHSGLLDKGWHYFNTMSEYYCIAPDQEHYACMVDLFGRAGYLDVAEDFINKMPFKPDVVVWGALLGACRMHGHMGLGELAAKKMLELEPQHNAAFVLLSNLYAATGRWDDVETLRTLMKGRGITKKPGCSWIQVNNTKDAFLVGDESHPHTEEIYETLERLNVEIKTAGYVPETDAVLHDVEDDEKEQLLTHHSEKLAIAFGLISTPPGTSLQIIKNLRVCGDCHSVMKFISKIFLREIVVRDTSRFHHFKDGLCSCSDYW